MGFREFRGPGEGVEGGGRAWGEVIVKVGGGGGKGKERRRGWRRS